MERVAGPDGSTSWWREATVVARKERFARSPSLTNDPHTGERTIDTRSATARALEPRIIPAAIHVPLKDVVQRVRELPTDRDIIVYCA
jgi:hypothetical protein